MNKVVLAVLLIAQAGMALAQNASKGQDRLYREVRHELVMLPYYSVFDDLAYKVNGYTVTLYGHVTTPTLTTDAERSVKTIEGVENGASDIDV